MNVFDFLLFTALQVEIDLKSLYFLSFHCMLISRLQVSPLKSQFSSKFRLDCSSMCMVIDLVICRHCKFTFPNLCRKDTMDIIAYNRSRKKTRHFTLLSKIGDQVLQQDCLGG